MAQSQSWGSQIAVEKNLDFVMLIYNLIEYIDKYAKASFYGNIAEINQMMMI